MNPVIIIRSEILSILILLFMLIYSIQASKLRTGKNFFIPTACIGLAHTVFGLLTEVSVNSLDVVPAWLNTALHDCLYMTAVSFAIAYFLYTLTLLKIPSRVKRIVARCMFALTGVLLLVVVISPVTYTQGNGTMYSSGIGAMLCFGLAILLFSIAVVILLANKRNIERSKFMAMVPLTVMALFFMVCQAFIQELLFSSAVVTIISIGTFFAVENPIGQLERRAYRDLMTGTYNRAKFDLDIKNLEGADDSKSESRALAFVMADMNGLKAINDQFGHAAGDASICAMADVLKRSLDSAYRIYRMGGDEFIALYTHADEPSLRSEVDAVIASSGKQNARLAAPLSIAVGYAIKAQDESLEEAIKRADRLMYMAKNEHYALADKGGRAR